MTISSVTGTYAVGNTVTGSTSNATATVTYVATDQSFLYVNNVSGTFQDSQTDNIVSNSGASGVLDALSTGVNRYFID